MKKILSLLLVLTCLMFSVCSLGISASAEDVYNGTCGADASDILTWAFDAKTGKLTISGEGFMQDYSTEAGMQAPWYAYRDQIKSVSLSENLSYIGAYAFFDCVELTTVTIPEYVIKIGASAFGGCVKLTEVIFEDTYDWCVMESADSEMIYLSEEDLSDPQTAATYLTDTYSGYVWSCEPAKGWGIDDGDLWWLIPLLILFLIFAIVVNCFPLIVVVLIIVGIVRCSRRNKLEKKKLEKEIERRKKLGIIGGIGLFAAGTITALLFKKKKK